MIGPPTYGPWHFWFAWYPVNTDAHGWRWLRTVERQKWWGGPWTGWDYRPTVDNRKGSL